MRGKEMLNSVGITNVFSARSLRDADKVNFSLHPSLPGAFVAISLWAGVTILRGYTKMGGIMACPALVSGLATLSLPSLLGYPFSDIDKRPWRKHFQAS